MPELLELMHTLDDSKSMEHPKGFDHYQAQQRFRAVVAALAELGIAGEAETGENIQDASFHSQLFIPDLLHKQTVIRFSNFGDLVAMTDDELMDPAQVQAIKSTLVTHGYVYVPYAMTLGAYRGHYYSVSEICQSWWDRFFDWC